MPAINQSIYVNLTAGGGPLWNIVKDITTATPLGTEPNPSKGANEYLTEPVYYVNNDNVDLEGYIFIPDGYVFDLNNIYIYSDGNGWRPFTSTNDCLENVGTTSNGTTTYTIWQYGYLDEDFGWISTKRNLSFNLTTI